MTSKSSLERKDSSIFFDGFLKGLSAPALLFARTAPSLPIKAEIIQHPRVADLDAMRGDWQRIGADFRTVIEHEESKPANQA